MLPTFVPSSFTKPFSRSAKKRLARQSRTHLVTPTGHLAIVGTVPSTFSKALLSAEFKAADISLERAISQHTLYAHHLSTTPSIKTVFQSPSDPRFPDCVFVEDPMVMISSRMAVMAAAGHPARSGEGEALAEVLKRVGVYVRRVADVRIDGGDVLKIAGFVLVGLSARTEAGAVEVLQNAFDDDLRIRSEAESPRVVGVTVDKELHLKSLVTWVGDLHAAGKGFLVAPEGEDGTEIVRRIVEATGREWEVAWVPERESLGANVLYVPSRMDEEGRVLNGAVFVQKSCRRAVEIVKSEVERRGIENVAVVEVDMSELAKANGALTCSSVIIV